MLITRGCSPTNQMFAYGGSLKLSGPHGGAHAYKSKCCVESFNLITQKVTSFIQGSAVCQKGVLQVMKMKIPR